MVPLVLTIAEAGRLIGLSRPAAYRAAAAGILPVADLPGRKRVIVRDFEAAFGPITAERLADAHRKLGASPTSAPAPDTAPQLDGSRIHEHEAI